MLHDWVGWDIYTKVLQNLKERGKFGDMGVDRKITLI
jgi:hypothetical protein